MPSELVDLNPIEQAFAKLKTFLRAAATRTIYMEGGWSSLLSDVLVTSD